MVNLLRKAAAWLESKRHAFTTDTVTYVRGDLAVIVAATVGRTQFQSEDAAGVLVLTEARDFLIRAADLALGGNVFEPASGDTRVGTVTYNFDTEEITFKNDGLFAAEQGSLSVLYFTRGWMALPIAAFDPPIPRGSILVAARLIDDWAAEGDVIGSGMAVILSMSNVGFDARDYGDNGSASRVLFDDIGDNWTPDICVSVEPLGSTMEFDWAPFPDGLPTNSPIQQAIDQNSLVIIGCYCSSEGDHNGGFRASPEDPWPIFEIDWLPGNKRRVCLPPQPGSTHRRRRRR